MVSAAGLEACRSGVGHVTDVVTGVAFAVMWGGRDRVFEDAPPTSGMCCVCSAGHRVGGECAAAYVLSGADGRTFAVRGADGPAAFIIRGDLFAIKERRRPMPDAARLS